MLILANLNTTYGWGQRYTPADIIKTGSGNWVADYGHEKTYSEQFKIIF